MASNLYTQAYANGTKRLIRRSTRQGRKPSGLAKPEFGVVMTRIIAYQAVTGETRYYAAKKSGPKPMPAEFLRRCRVFASVTKSMRDKLDAEIVLSPFSESDIVEMALRSYFSTLDQERIIYGLLHSNLLNT